MAKSKGFGKGKKTLNDLLDQIQNSLTASSDKVNEVPDIITFIEDEKYLGLGTGKQKHVKLFPLQKAILKVFYRGSRGNENLRLTDAEIELLKKEGLWREKADSECDRGDVLGKYNSNVPFRELVLVWGRRSGKDFLVSLIALYEAMRLLEVPGGDPYEYYKLAPGADITILTIAASQDQAQVAFREIREKLRVSRYFQDKFKKEGLQAESITLLTHKDKLDNIEFTEKGQAEKLGSVKIEVGHSNPDTLVGKSCFVLILDEVASYRGATASAASQGEKIYSLLQPTTSTYVREMPIFDDKGQPVMDPETGEQKVDYIYEGKVVSISSPRGKSGKLWSLWEKHWDNPGVLGCRLPTWVVNKRQLRENLRREFAAMSETEFNCEFGAEFTGTAGEDMFPVDLVKECFKNTLKFRDIGEPGKIYFVQLDPATNSHNYALVVCHKETFLDPETDKSDFCIVVDLVKFWSPTSKSMIEVSQVDEYVVSLKRRFHLGFVAYDAWQSVASIQKLRKHGIPADMRKYLRQYKMEIYKELEELLKGKRIKIPLQGRESDLLMQEMIHLQRKFDGNGFKVYPKKDGDVCKTDDVVDALAGACYLALQQNVSGLPRAKLVNTGFAPSAQNIVWRSMQGVPYGVGSGTMVAKQMDRRFGMLKNPPFYGR